jgi:glycosyltransferase involved in cell wall biosynthesis
MNILYDGRIYTIQVAGGINRYYANIISRLPQNAHPTLLSREIRDTNWPGHANLKIVSPEGSSAWPPLLARMIDRQRLCSVVRSTKPDIVHPTFYQTITQDDFRVYPHPIVLTVYDMTMEKVLASKDVDGVQRRIKKKAILAADAIICISHHTRKDLLELYSIPEERVVVTHLASEIDAGMAQNAGKIPEAPYFLFVGTRRGYKNFALLLDAFSKVAERQKDVRLCVVGAPFTHDEKRSMADLKVDGRVDNVGYVADRYLAKLYRCSVAFVYPSCYEGFGIPLLEAMACGTPVVASNCTSIPEVVGDAALLFDPCSGEELTEGLLRLLSSVSIRKDLIEKGYQRVKLFSWDVTATKTIEVYKSLC